MSSGGLDGELLILGQDIRADELDDLHQLALLLEQVGHPLAALVRNSGPTFSSYQGFRSAVYSE